MAELNTLSTLLGSTEWTNNTFGLSSNVKGYWRLEDNTNDSSVNGNNLTLAGSPSYADAIFGKGLDLELSSSQYAYVADSASLSITGDISMIAWIKLESLPASGAYMTICGKWDPGENKRSYLLYLYNDGGNIRVEAYFSKDGTASNQLIQYTGTNITSADLGQWVMLGVSLDVSTETCKIFKNGSEQSSTKSLAGSISSLHDNNADFSIGARKSSGTWGNFVDGIVDDVVILDTILTPDQISQLYGAVAYWRMESGAITADSKGSYTLTKNGTVNNETGKYGSCASAIFNNTNNLQTTLYTPGTNNITYSVWINKSSAPSNDFSPRIIDISDASAIDLYLSIEKTTGKVSFNSFVNPTGVSSGNSPSSICDGLWHHVVGVKNNTTMAIFVDGQLANSATVTNQNINANTLRFGWSGNATYDHLGQALIDDVAIFSRALTADEVLTLYKEKSSSWFMFM